jgi:uncharacterized protein GlcG (DUF336 family)
MRAVASAAVVAGFSLLNAQVAPDAVLTHVITERSLSLRYEIESANAAIQTCALEHVHATVVIVDSRGNTKLQMVGDGGNYNLLDEARRKARTAVLMSRSTATLLKTLAANPNMHIPPDTDFLVVAGGVPFRAGSDMVGAIGVAGGPPEFVDGCAESAVEKLVQYLHPEEPHP